MVTFVFQVIIIVLIIVRKVDMFDMPLLLILFIAIDSGVNWCFQDTPGLIYSSFSCQNRIVVKPWIIFLMLTCLLSL